MLTLTPEAVSAQSGAHLHRFAWLDDADVGEVPFSWNFLVGHNRVDPADVAGTTPRAIHYTSGGPWFERAVQGLRVRRPLGPGARRVRVRGERRRGGRHRSAIIVCGCSGR
uniref:Uncharacterized protein n=1 Tax=Aegilops tauschii subsp. strangulata TaxID=200361 RepID=A0A452XE16_AEGTS